MIESLDRLTAAMRDPAGVMAVSVRHTVGMAERDPIWGWCVARLGPQEISRRPLPAAPEEEDA